MAWRWTAAATARADAGGEKMRAHWVAAAPRKLVKGVVHPWRRLRVEHQLVEELGDNNHAHAVRSVHWLRRERERQSLGGSGDVGCDGSISGSGVGCCGSVDGGSTGGFSGIINCGDSGRGMSSH